MQLSNTFSRIPKLTMSKPAAINGARAKMMAWTPIRQQHRNGFAQSLRANDQKKMRFLAPTKE